MKAPTTARDRLREFEHSDWRSWGQLLETACGLAGSWLLTAVAMQVSIWLGALASLAIAVFLVRAFILFHDCGHGSFSSSRRANALVGSLLGVLVFTPYRRWTRDHARHHATVGDLDRRGSGDVWMMTVEEFLAAPSRTRRWYRVYHHSVFIASIGPVLKFLFFERLSTGCAKRDPQIRREVHLTNLAIVGYVAMMTVAMGPLHFVVAQLVALAAAAIPAVCLFYAQHYFEGTYWRRHAQWDYFEASLIGSSRIALPRFLQWVTGNIGYHHLHHLAPRIPNYLLPEAQAACPDLQAGCTLTLRTVFSVPRTNLWDEAKGCYVSFAEAECSPAA